MPLSEKPKKAPNKCPNNTFNDQEKLKKIQEELGKLPPETVEWDFARSEKDPKPKSKPKTKPAKSPAETKHETKLRVIPYNPKIFENPEEYYRYIASSITSPEDIMVVLRELMTHYSDPQDRMFPAHMVVAAGFGDCENYSWLAKCLLDELGCKNNFDYKSRVIGIGTHAVCIYIDEKGDTWSINQHERKKINTIYEASARFEKQKEESIDEERLYNGNIQERILLDENLANNYKEVTYILYDQNFDKSFDPDKILPKEWKKYRKTQLNFKNNVVAIYINGKIDNIDDENRKEMDLFDEEGALSQRKYADGSLVFFYKGTEKVSQRNYAEGEVKIEHFDLDGALVQRTLRDGVVESYNPKTKKIDSRFFPDGDVETEFFSQDGEVKERHFRKGDIETEFYSPNGKVTQRNFHENPGEKYKTKWYDSDGRLKQTETFGGEIEVLTTPSPTP